MANEILPFKALTESLAEQFGVSPEEMIATLKSQCFPGGAASNGQLMMLCSFAKTYDLNPLARECYAFVSGGKMTVGVQVDGWSKIANREPAYDGMEMEYEKDDKGNVIAITSKTFVKGRAHPTTYRAVMKEWYRGASDVWKSMPEHQLYVKARNEGIRFAFGIPAYDPDDIQRMEQAVTVETTGSLVTIPESKLKPLFEEAAAAQVSGSEPAGSPPAAEPEPVRPAVEPEVVKEEKPKARAKKPETFVEPSPAAVAFAVKVHKADARQHLDKLIAEHVPNARLQLILGQHGVSDVKDLTDEQVDGLIARIEKRAK